MTALFQRPDGLWAETSPPSCPAGHPTLAGLVLVGWAPCSCAGGHLVHGGECGQITYAPPCQAPESRFTGAYPGPPAGR